MRSELQKLPEVFVGRLEEIFPPKKFHELINTLAFKKPLSFRINTSRITISDAKEALAHLRIKIFSVPWYSDAYYTFETLGKIQKTIIYQKGLIYLQSLSSMLPPLVLKPQKNESVLDMAAAPGGKSLLMANLMANTGLITAYEKNRIRLEKLLYNINLQEAKNIVVRMGDSSLIWKEYRESFDKILLDAPCSNEALYYINEPETFRHFSQEQIKMYSLLQKKMLASALVSLKIGGVLVYSTCTFAPEENEEVIDWAVQMAGTQIEILPINLKLSNISPPLKRFRNHNYSKAIRLAVRVMPTKIMGGFFICKIKKISKINV